MMNICASNEVGLPENQRVGVVIPVYNRRTILLETLQCVVNQTRQPERVVIVDDGSTDGTPAAATQWLTAARPRFEWQVIRAIHRSAGIARNIGLQHVRSLPLVTFLDSDDRWPCDLLDRGVAALAAKPQAAAAIADRRFVDAPGESVDETDCRAVVDDPVTWFFQNGAGVASCTLLRTAAVLQAGAWSETLESSEDAVLFSAIAMSAEWVHVAGTPVVFGMGSAQARREEHNLSERRADRHLHWARDFERIYQTVRAVRSDRSCASMRKALGQRWYMAGKQLFKLGRADECRECFARAVYWHPLMFRAWRKLAVTRISRQSEPAVAAAPLRRLAA